MYNLQIIEQSHDARVLRMARTPSNPPQVLDADYGPQTIHGSDLFFIDTPMNTQDVNPPSPSQLYPYHQQAFHHYSPPLRDSPRPYPQQSVYPSYVHTPIPPPPLPPKPPPIVYPQIPPYAGPSQPHLVQPPPIPPPQLPPPPPPQKVEVSPIDDSSDELAMAMALSKSESAERQKLDEELLDQEEQDLARALAESMSMLSTGGSPQNYTNPFAVPASQVASSSRTTTHDTRTEASPKRPPVGLPPQDVPHKVDVVYPADPTNPFADIRRYDKWRIPDNSQEELAPIGSRPESSSPNRFSFSGLSFPIPEPANETTETARSASRPSSISSASSLPYTFPDPPIRSNTLDTRDSLPEYSQAGATQFTPRDAPVAGPSTIPTNVDVVHVEETMDTVLVFDDEAYARQLEAEEQELARQYSEEKSRPPDMQGEQPSGEGLPQYSSSPQQSSWQRIEMVPSRLVIPPQTMPSTSGASRPTPTQPPHPAVGGAQLRQQEYSPRPINTLPEAGPSAQFYSSPKHRRQSDSDTRSDASHQSSAHSSTGPQTAHPERPHPQSERRPSYSAVPPQADNRVPQHVPTPGALNANHFLDRELLLGVCMSFHSQFP